MELSAVPYEPLEEFPSAASDEATEVRALARAIKRGNGFSLLFACCNDSTRREEVTAELSKVGSTGGAVPRTVFLAHGESVGNLATTLRERLADGPPPGAVFVNGLENILPRASEAGQSVFVANLNAYRNVFPTVVPCPLILWVSDWLLGVLARSAPDFFSVKSGIYFFRESDLDEREPSRRASETTVDLDWENVPRDELRARAEEIRAMLDAPRDPSRENLLFEARFAGRLGVIYLTLYQLLDAEAAYTRSQKILENLLRQSGNDNDETLLDLAGVTYHQLGRIAEERRDFVAAEDWYRRSLEIKERQGDKHGAASTYHQLGTIAGEQRDFTAAEDWYRRSLEIKERQGNEHGAASTYHQLGTIAGEQRDFTAAEDWYRRSLEISERQGNEHGAANTYHQLGMVAQEQRDFAAAEDWYRRSLEIEERLGNEHGAAITYHQLGRIAQERRDFTAAEDWYRRSLEINERQGNVHGAASTYGQFGITAALQKDFENAGHWLLKSIKEFTRVRDARGAQRNTGNFVLCYQQASATLRPKLRAMWESAGIGPFPSEAEDDSEISS